MNNASGTNSSSQINFKTTMLKSYLCDYSDAYILVKRAMKIIGAGEADALRQAEKRNK